MDKRASSGIIISGDSIAYSTSGLLNPQKNAVMSYLHKAIKPVNQLRMIEDSLVIYRISRAPERRIFYIDVGNLPKKTRRWGECPQTKIIPASQLEPELV